MNTKEQTLIVGDDILVFVPNEGWLNGRITEPMNGSGVYGIHGPAEGRFAHPRKAHESVIIRNPGFQIKPGMEFEMHLLESDNFPVEGWYRGHVESVSASSLKANVPDYRGHNRQFLLQPHMLRAIEKKPNRAPRTRKTSQTPDPWAVTAGTVVSEAKYVAEDMDYRIVALEAAKELLASSNIEDIMRLTNFILTGRDND